VAVDDWSLLLSFHQPAVLPVLCEWKSGEVEKAKSRLAGVSGPHGAIDIR
jgi:hypothetical protein